MTWLLSILCGLACALAGGFAGGVISDACTRWYHVRDNTGASSILAFFAVVLGLAVGLVLGLVASRYAPGGRFAAALGCGLAAVLIVAGLTYVVTRAGGDVPPTVDGSRIQLQVELRSPQGWKLSNRIRTGTGSLTLSSLNSENHERWATFGSMSPQGARLEGGRYVIPGDVFVFTSKGRRVIHAQLDGEDFAPFDIPLPPHPDRRNLRWSDWLPAGKSDGFDYRFRIERLADEERQRNERNTAREQSFAGLGPNSPIQAYLAYLEDPSWDVRNKVSRVVSQRAAELIPLLDLGDRENIRLALRGAVEQNPLPAAFERPLLAVLRGLIQDLRKLRRTAESDPDKLESADLQRMFIDWSTAWKNCHSAGPSIPAELQELVAEAEKFEGTPLEEARNIAPLAKRYLSEWASAASAR